jgi:uncharacterized XkdX family phage protein
MRERIEKWYKMGLWTKDMVRSAVDKGKLTVEEYAEITGETYVAV